MDDWESLAKLMGFNSEREMWEGLYTEEGFTIIELSNRFKCGTTTIGRRMEMFGIKKHGKGGPNNFASVKKKLHHLDQRFVYLSSDKKLARLLDAHLSTIWHYKNQGRSKHGFLRDNPNSSPGPVRDAEQDAPSLSADTESLLQEILQGEEKKGG